MIVRALALAAAACVAPAGCASPVPYRPERAVVRSIPPERAKEALRAAKMFNLNAVAHAEYARPVAVVAIDDESFTIRGERIYGGKGVGAGPTVERRYRFADLAPHAYGYRDGLFVKLTGEWKSGMATPNSPANPTDPGDDCVWLAKREELEMFVDALESLKADALARPPAPPR